MEKMPISAAATGTVPSSLALKGRFLLCGITGFMLADVIVGVVLRLQADHPISAMVGLFVKVFVLSSVWAGHRWAKLGVTLLLIFGALFNGVLFLQSGSWFNFGTALVTGASAWAMARSPSVAAFLSHQGKLSAVPHPAIQTIKMSRE